MNSMSKNITQSKDVGYMTIRLALIHILKSTPTIKGKMLRNKPKNKPRRDTNLLIP